MRNEHEHEQIQSMIPLLEDPTVLIEQSTLLQYDLSTTS